MAAIKHHNRLDILGQEVVDKLQTVVHIPEEDRNCMSRCLILDLYLLHSLISLQYPHEYTG